MRNAPAPVTFAAINRDARPPHLLAFLAVGLAVALALVGVDRWLVRPRPTEQAHPDPAQAGEVSPPDDAANQPDPPPWMKVSYLEKALAYGAPDLTMVQPDPRSPVCFVFGGSADPTTVDGLLPPSEDYADCWRGAVECVADPPASWGNGPHAWRAGDVRLFGDLELMERVKPAAEKIHFGPYRGTGQPTPPSP